MRWYAVSLLCLGIVSSSSAAELTPAEAAKGWLMLFDGETTFGWKGTGSAKVDGGKLILGGGEATTFEHTTDWGACELKFEYEPCDGAKLTFHRSQVDLPVSGTGKRTAVAAVEPNAKGGHEVSLQLHVEEGNAPIEVAQSKTPIQRHRIAFSVPAGKKLVLSKVWLKPILSKSLFNGKDVRGWKEFPDRKSKFTVTPEGWLNVKDGPGDLATVDQFADFVLQLECISNGDFLNSGIFFRCIPDQYQQGYEAQIRNQYVGGDRTKPFDFGTGAIYRRVATRKVVPNDKEWFTMTIVASKNHIATWVNGYPTAIFDDDRPAADNARKGTKLSKGTISIQGHDPTTDLSFRNFRIDELPAIKE